jgi:uncharacterized protein
LRIFYNTVIKGFLIDCKSDKKTPTVIVRVFRSSRILFGLKRINSLIRNKAYQKHIDYIDKDDRLFFLSYKYFLVKGLSARERIKTALFHYKYETNKFDETYFNHVYHQSGLTLWASTVNDTKFDIRLQPGNDFLYEGSCSVVLHVNGERVCVISYSMVPSEIFLPNTHNKSIGKSEALIFVTRKHLNRDHTYQNEYNKAFDRVMPAQMCMSALAAIGLSQGHNSFLGICYEAHPSIKPERISAFDAAYDQFWISLNGQKVLPYGYLTELPIYMKPLDDMEPKARKRALSRRKHLQEVFEQSYQTMHKHVLANK